MIETAERARGQTPGTTRWAVAAQVVLLTLGVAIAMAVRRLILSETLGDRASLSLTIASLVLLACFVGLSSRMAIRLPAIRARRFLLLVPVALAAVLCLLGRELYPETSVEMASLTETASTPGQGTVIVLGPGNRDVRLSGELLEGAATRLAALLDTHPDVRRIALTSEGGLADEGEALGEVVAAHRLDTYVPDYCVSACTLIFVRGQERFAMNGARIGFHGPFEQGLFGKTFAGDASAAKAAYVEAGIQSSFADQALKVAPDDMWFPSPERLLSAHVATAFVTRDRFPDSDLDGSDTLEGARTQLLANFPILTGLLPTSPAAVDRIAGWYLAAYRRGVSEAVAVQGVRAIIRGAVAVALAHADDDTALALLGYLDEALAVARSPEVCQAIGEQADLVEAASQLRAVRKDADAAASTLVARSLAANRQATAAAAKPHAHAADANACAIVRGTYASVRARPRAEAAARMKTMLANRASAALAAVKVAAAL